MKNLKPFRLLIGMVGVVIITLVCSWEPVANLSAQDVVVPPRPVAPVLATTPAAPQATFVPGPPHIPMGQSPAYSPYALGSGYRPAIAGANRQDSQKIQEALKQLRSEDADEDAKDAAINDLTEILGKLFDADLDQRTEKIEHLEKQIDDLKQQVKKRREAKERLIELRIEVMRNESEGLAFPSSWSHFTSPGAQPYTTTYPRTLGAYQYQSKPSQDLRQKSPPYRPKTSSVR